MFSLLVLIVAFLLYWHNYGEGSAKPEYPSLSEPGSSLRLPVRNFKRLVPDISNVTNATEIPDLLGGVVWFANASIGGQSLSLQVDTARIIT